MESKWTMWIYESMNIWIYIMTDDYAWHITDLPDLNTEFWEICSNTETFFTSIYISARKQMTIQEKWSPKYDNTALKMTNGWIFEHWENGTHLLQQHGYIV